MIGLPGCNGGNGVAGLDCQSAWGYPKKTVGRPYGPMNDAYPEGHPRYASRAQQDNNDNSADTGTTRNASTDEADTETIPELPLCTGAKGENRGVDCKARPFCTGAKTEVVGTSCRKMPLCTGAANEIPGTDCKKPQTDSSP